MVKVKTIKEIKISLEILVEALLAITCLGKSQHEPRFSKKLQEMTVFRNLIER